MIEESYCPRCSGHGVLLYTARDSADDDVYECPDCDGTGFRSGDEFEEVIEELCH